MNSTKVVIGSTVFANQNQVIASFVGTVLVVASLRAAMGAAAYVHGFVAEFRTHTVVEYVERAFP